MTCTRAPMPAARSAASETAFAAVSDPSVATSIESIIGGPREPYPPAVRLATSMGRPVLSLYRCHRPRALLIGPEHIVRTAKRDRPRQGPPRLSLQGSWGTGK